MRATLGSVVLAAIALLAGPATAAWADHPADVVWIHTGVSSEEEARAYPCTSAEAGGWERTGPVVCVDKRSDTWELHYEVPDGRGCTYDATGWHGTCVFDLDEGTHIRIWGTRGIPHTRVEVRWLHAAPVASPEAEPSPAQPGQPSPEQPQQPEPVEQPEQPEQPEATEQPERTERPEPREQPEPADPPSPHAPASDGANGTSLAADGAPGRDSPPPSTGPADDRPTTDGGPSDDGPTGAVAVADTRSQSGDAAPWGRRSLALAASVALVAAVAAAASAIAVRHRGVDESSKR